MLWGFLRRLGTILLWLVLLAVAIATVFYFWNRWRATQGSSSATRHCRAAAHPAPVSFYATLAG